jgi:hypothetical protein
MGPLSSWGQARTSRDPGHVAVAAHVPAHVHDTKRFGAFVAVMDVALE